MRHLTVSILNLNQAQLTIDVTENLARLSTLGWGIQLILVDNHSRDEDAQRLLSWSAANGDRFAEILFIAVSENLGCGGGHNLAFRLASADQILILDNDLVLPDSPDWLETLWQRMQEDAGAGIVGPMLTFAHAPELVQGAGMGLTPSGQAGYLHRGEPAEQVPPTLVEVVASASACWLLRKDAQQAVGLFADEFSPMQYEDVDLCVRLRLAGWKILCDRSVRVQHIENVTTRSLEDHPYDRVSVRHGMRFRRKWARILPEIATITREDIYWGSTLRAEG